MAQKARAESESLEEQLSTTQNLVEACKKEIEMHKEEKSHLEKRIVEVFFFVIFSLLFEKKSKTFLLLSSGSYLKGVEVLMLSSMNA